MTEQMKSVKQKTDRYNYYCCPEQLPHQTPTHPPKPYLSITSSRSPPLLCTLGCLFYRKYVDQSPCHMALLLSHSCYPLRVISASGTIIRLSQGRGPHLVPVTQGPAPGRGPFHPGLPWALMETCLAV